MGTFDLSHIKMIEGVEEFCGPFLMDVYNVLFNENKISLEETMRLVAAGMYSSYVLKIPQAQYEGMCELLGYKYPSFRAAARMTPCCSLSFIPAYPDLQDDADHPRCSATG